MLLIESKNYLKPVKYHTILIGHHVQISNLFLAKGGGKERYDLVFKKEKNMFEYMPRYYLNN